MAFKPQQLRALNTISGLLKDGRDITKGTFFECKDEETEAFLLRSRSAEVAEIPSGPEVVKDAPARGRPPKTKTKTKTKTETEPETAPKTKGDGDKDLV